MNGSRLSIRWKSTATYAVPASKCDGSICATRAPRRQAGDVLRDVVQLAPPSFVFQTLPSLVPAQISPCWISRRRDREHHLAVELPEVVADDAARRARCGAGRASRGRADHRPALPAVRRLEDHLAAVVDGVVIERIDRERRRPVAAVLRLVRRRVERDAIRAHRPRRLGPRVVARHLVAVAGGPDDVRIGRVGDGEARLAAAEAVVATQRCPAPVCQSGRGRRACRPPIDVVLGRASCRRPACCCRPSTAPGCRRRRGTSGRSAARRAACCGRGGW